MGKTCFSLNYFIHNYDRKIKRIQQLMNLSHEYKKVIITCSTDFFPIDPCIVKEKGYEQIGSKDRNDYHYHKFRKICMSNFNVIDVRKYINFLFSIFNFNLKTRIQFSMEESPQIKITPLFLNYPKEVLQKAVHQEEPSLMKYSRKKQTVMINPNYIKISKQYQKDVKEYNSLAKNTNIVRLSIAIGLKGLIKLNSINQSKKFYVLPDLKTFKKFTLYFWVN